MNAAQLNRRMRGWLRGEYKGCVFEEAGSALGYCIYRKEKEFLYIRQFYIEPAHRRKGLGLRALRVLRKTVWKKYPLLRMDVLVDNGPGVRFWRAAGFRDYCLTLESDNR
ncbi:MAG TPA: GNAT family N-acetyltransferase [bacterium]|nr:GNAT family N-acetyltransferase [bacterium]